MIKGLLEFIQRKKPELVHTETISVKVSEGGGYCSTCWYPSQYEEQEVEVVDWEKFEQALEEFSLTFQEGGDNAHRNPLNKD